MRFITVYIKHFCMIVCCLLGAWSFLKGNSGWVDLGRRRDKDGMGRVQGWKLWSGWEDLLSIRKEKEINMYIRCNRFRSLNHLEILGRLVCNNYQILSTVTSAWEALLNIEYDIEFSKMFIIPLSLLWKCQTLELLSSEKYQIKMFR